MARSRATHCPRGHVFDRPNTYVRKDGRRMCRTCARERQRERRTVLRCPRCLGKGKVLLRGADGRLERAYAPCPLCAVADRREAPPKKPAQDKPDCPKCQGRGWLYQQQGDGGEFTFTTKVQCMCVSRRR